MPIAKSNGAVLTAREAGVDVPADVAQTAPAPVSRKLDTGVKAAETSYSDGKNRRILVQGITQAVVQSPIVAGLSNYTTPEHVSELVKKVSLDLINFVESQS